MQESIKKQFEKRMLEQVKDGYKKQYKKVTSTRVMVSTVIWNLERMYSEILSGAWGDEATKTAINNALHESREVDYILSQLQSKFLKV